MIKCKSKCFMLNIFQSLWYPFVDQFENPWITRPQNSETNLIVITIRKKCDERLSPHHLFSLPPESNRTGQAHSLHLQNFISWKLIEYTFFVPLSFSSFHSFFFFLFLTFGNEGKCTGNLLTALFTLALVREKIWIFDHLVLMFSNKINIFVCKKRNLYVLARGGKEYYI